LPTRAIRKKYRVIRVSTWAEYRDLVDSEEMRSWGFRGQADASWKLFSGLSRSLKQGNVHRSAWQGQEARILRLFKAKAHLHVDHVPPDDDAYQWLALMQHHGAPTRLLDITWSPYVALFFALERATKPAAVWAFLEPAISDRPTVTIRGGVKIKPHNIAIWRPGAYERYYLPGSEPFVTVGKPKVMNQRLIVQSGSFIVPGVIDEPVEDILNDYPSPKDCLIKIEIDTSKVRKEAMQRLYSMNITNASLFPDLDGLSRSLAFELEYHWGFDPEDMTPRHGFPNPKKLLSWATTKGTIYPHSKRTRVTTKK
jgi:FRG domain